MPCYMDLGGEWRLRGNVEKQFNQKTESQWAWSPSFAIGSTLLVPSCIAAAKQPKVIICVVFWVSISDLHRR